MKRNISSWWGNSCRLTCVKMRCSSNKEPSKKNGLKSSSKSSSCRSLLKMSDWNKWLKINEGPKRQNTNEKSKSCGSSGSAFIENNANRNCLRLRCKESKTRGLERLWSRRRRDCWPNICKYCSNTTLKHLRGTDYKFKWQVNIYKSSQSLAVSQICCTTSRERCWEINQKTSTTTEQSTSRLSKK